MPLFRAVRAAYASPADAYAARMDAALRSDGGMRMRWLPAYMYCRPDGGRGFVTAHGWRLPLIVERLSDDGEWELMDRLDAVTADPTDLTCDHWWRTYERRLAARNHLDTPGPRVTGTRPFRC